MRNRFTLHNVGLSVIALCWVMFLANGLRIIYDVGFARGQHSAYRVRTELYQPVHCNPRGLYEYKGLLYPVKDSVTLGRFVGRKYTTL